jgi:hypothetical protein
MKIKCIFENSLYAIQYADSPLNEFNKTFDLWANTQKLWEFFKNNYEDLQSGHFGAITIEDAVVITLKTANEMEQIFVDLSKKTIEDQNKCLGSLFEPLHKRNEGMVLEKSKAKKNWLRIYALRIGENKYIVTGGAIKLTNAMAERKHTSIELRKLENIRTYLIKNQIISPKDIVEEMEF